MNPWRSPQILIRLRRLRLRQCIRSTRMNTEESDRISQNAKIWCENKGLVTGIRTATRAVVCLCGRVYIVFIKFTCLSFIYHIPCSPTSACSEPHFSTREYWATLKLNLNSPHPNVHYLSSTVCLMLCTRCCIALTGLGLSWGPPKFRKVLRVHWGPQVCKRLEPSRTENDEQKGLVAP